MAVYSFGAGKMGQLGLGNLDDFTSPSVLEGLKGKRIVSVSCGEQHSMAIDEFGDLYVWGRGREGQLANETRQNSNVPLLVKELRHEKVVKSKCGYYHCVAVTETGRVYTWGKLHKVGDPSQKKQGFGGVIRMPGMKGQKMSERSWQAYLKGDSTDSSSTEEFGQFEGYIQSVPLLVSSLLGRRVVECAAGYSCSAIVTDRGELFTFGFNEKGQLGLGHRFNKEEPQLVTALTGENIKNVSCGQQHMACINQNGDVFTFGLGVFGQLGHGELSDELLPRRIEELSKRGIKVKQIECGSFHTVALSNSGELYSWGHGEYGQHGGSKNHQDWNVGENDGKNNNERHHFHSIPRLLQGFEEKSIDTFSCGHLHTVAVTTDREVFTWGWGSSGCLGHGDKRFQLVPKQVLNLSGEPVTTVSAGWRHSLVVKAASDSTFAFDFKEMINNPKYSDLTFEVEGKLVYGHKSIIFYRCPKMKSQLLFDSRFRHLRGENPIHKVLGVKHSVFLGLLFYLYCDHLRVPPHLTRDLAKLAKIYRLPRLEAMCLRGISKELHSTIPESTFSSDMSRALNDPELSDVKFRLEGETIFAHKAILKARCQYFHRLFESDFKERELDEFDFDDGSVSPSTFLDLLRYVYCGDESILKPDNAVDLLSGSDRFMLEDFQLTVEAFIVQSIEAENAAWLLEIADRYRAMRLRRSCIEFICESGRENLEEVLKSQAFFDLHASSVQLVREVDYKASKNDLCKPGEVIRRISNSSTQGNRTNHFNNSNTVDFATNNLPLH
eukprot:TRINITY_DN4148_c0_g2_i2.p1 TRINITY_DN4148_c0_g2~~TRINITY_DN4148_c0_g2_i2.p1  ORF type:complete len:779 (+),score=239.68 TRINITY_DN4148_c0_g2_i2:397-2733(+)